MAKQKYTEEFKKEDFKMALESGETNDQIADNIGVKYKTPWNWIQKSMIKLDTSNQSIDYKSIYQELVDEVTKLKKDLKQTSIDWTFDAYDIYFININIMQKL
jgi:transposase-like protein